MYTWTRN